MPPRPLHSVTDSYAERLNGFIGAFPEIARRCSVAGGWFFSVYWNIHAAGMVTQAIDGTVTARFESLYPFYHTVGEWEHRPQWAMGPEVEVNVAWPVCTHAGAPLITARFEPTKERGLHDLRSSVSDADECFAATRLGRIAATLVVLIVVSGVAWSSTDPTRVSDMCVPGATLGESMSAGVVVLVCPRPVKKVLALVA